jgi:hypothetical protein
MAVTGYNSDIYVAQFSQNVALLSQQKISKLMRTVTMQDCFGEQAQHVVQYGTTDFAELTDPTADTAFDTIDKTARWIFPTDYKNVLAVAREDELQTITDPTNPLVMGQAAALGRLYDSVILTALTADCSTGKFNSLTTTSFDSDNALGSSTTAFTLDLMKDAITVLDDNDVDAMDRWAVISPKMARILLDDPEFTSSDYNTSKALAGQMAQALQGYLGLNWVISTQLPDATASTSKYAYIYQKSGIAMGIWGSDGQSVFSRIDPRPDKNYIKQVYSKVMLGATRVEESKVVTIENTADYA